MSQHQILVLDIEITPSIGYTWGKWEVNVIEFIRNWHLLSFAYKWLGEKTNVLALPDFKGYKPGCDDKELLKPLWNLLDEAQIVVAQNGDKFDIRKINTRFLTHNMTPPSPYKTVDTLKIARSKFGFNSNKLDDLGADLGVGRKVKHDGFDLWKGCMAGDMRSWATMKRYNIQDVYLLEKVYLKFRPWHSTHPSVINDKLKECPKCGHDDLISRGSAYTKTMIYKRFRCNKCGGWSKGVTGERIARYANA